MAFARSLPSMEEDMPKRKHKKGKPRLSNGFIRNVKVQKRCFYWDEEPPVGQLGLGLRVSPSGNKTFVVQYRYQGRLRWYMIDQYGAIGLKEARAAARIIRARAALGEDPQGEKVQARKEAREGETFEQVHRSYVENSASRRNKSWPQQDKMMKRYVLPTLGRRKIKHIARKDLRAIFDELTGAGRGALANQVMAAASATFSYAVKQEIIDANPVKGVERNKLSPGTRFLSNDEIRTVWPLFDNLGLYQSTVLKLVLLTASRPGEVCAMCWDHIDWDERLWTMPGAPTKGWPGTKNKRDHDVPLTGTVLTLLRELDPAGAHELGKKGFVFPSTKRGRHIVIPSIRTIWQENDIPRFRPHDLRATAATGMDRLGILKENIRLVLNHVDGDVTDSYIRHHTRERKLSTLKRWSEELHAIRKSEGKTDRKAEVVNLAQATG